MELAYQGEITTPSRCGRMDQGCAYGDRPVLMAFDGDRLSTEEVRPARDLHFVIVDLNAGKDTLEILKRLNRCYPFAEGTLERGVQELLGPINKRIVGEAREALESGDGERLGALMTEAQAFFDRYAAPACPEELTAPVLHRVLCHEPLQPHIWGGKGVGSQGDGTAQFIARGPADQQAVVEILERDLGLTGLTLTLGTGPKVRKAVIPAAGFGTRLFPATKATKKELFPIIDRDGIAQAGDPRSSSRRPSRPASRRSSSSCRRRTSTISGRSSPRRSRSRTTTSCPAPPGVRATHPGDRPPRPLRDADDAGGLRSRRVLRPGGGRRRAVPADAGRPPLPLERTGVVRAAGHGRVPADRHQRRRPAADARGGDRSVRRGDGRVDGGQPAPERHGVRREADRRLRPRAPARDGTDRRRVPDGLRPVRPQAADLRLPRGAHPATTSASAASSS